LPTAATDSAETNSPAVTPAVLDSEETSTRLVAIPTVPPTPTEIPTVPPTLVATTSAPPTPAEILMAHPTPAETISLHHTTTTILAKLEIPAMDQAETRSSDTTTNPLVNLLAMMT
jgi:hypothetical protein